MCTLIIQYNNDSNDNNYKKNFKTIKKNLKRINTVR